ncbi:hypothetical protein BD626DRAFT_510316 [Schizophyllum amplum]|uniref:DUF6697 domain-containing protein n=1 Tax=Schizophyllum amplum TaxID=97359 RepID=A0A550C1X3_9AGAR|nr:hypothetical protein BD626DRAFT_510316 [Auriculariopsis ampla]
MPHLATPVSNVPSRSATPARADANPQTTTPSRPRRKTTPRSGTRAALAGLTAEELDDKMSLFLTIKQEDADGKEIESFREEGDMLWDMDSLDRQPLYQKAFERKVVSWAWHAFGDVVSTNCPHFVRVSSNQWRYSGHYSCKMYGELDSTQMARVPRSCLVFIARDYIKKKWGREAIAAENKINMEKAENEGTVYHPILETEDSICAAFLDGRMTMSFTILEYIRFDDSWFQKLLDAEKAGRRIAPKYKTSTKRKRTPSSDMDPPAKKRKGRSGAAVPPEEPVSIVEPVAKEEESDSEVEYIGRTNAPASSGRRLRSATQALSRQMAMDFSTADSDDEEGEEVSDEEDDNDEC